MEFLAVGGDLRLHYAGRALAAAGHTVLSRGTPQDGRFPTGEEYRAAEGWLLPMPLCRGERLFARAEGAPEISLLPRYARRGLWVFGGGFPPELADALRRAGAEVRDYLDDGVLALENAALTAEGALAAFMTKSGTGVRGTRCAVTGYGRIARALAALLSAVGARVTVFARKETDRAEAALAGYGAEPLAPGCAFRGFDALFNTVPVPIFPEESFREAGMTAVFDLADAVKSAPGAAALIPMKGVPGSYAPRAAGACIARSVCRALREREARGATEDDV